MTTLREKIASEPVENGPLMAIACPKAGTFAAHGEHLHRLETSGGVVRMTSSGDELSAALKEAQDSCCKRLVIVGGDGSISRTVNLLSTNAQAYEIAVIPAGTGNDLARSLGLPINDPALAWEIALRGEVRPIDIAQIAGETSGYFVNSITAGFGGRQAAASVDKEQKSAWGKLAYWLSALANFGDMPEFDLTLMAEGQRHQVRVLGFWIANGRYVGGGFPVAPTATLNDGLLDVIAIPSLPALELLAAGVGFTISGPEESDQVISFRAAKVTASSVPKVPLSVDGEPVTASSFECSVLPQWIRVVTGPIDPAFDAQALNEANDSCELQSQ